MKNIGIILALCFITMIVTGSLATNYYEKNWYPSVAIVTNIDTDRDIVTIKDFNGHLWQFEGVEDYEIGDTIPLIMNKNWTPEIKDDEIEKTRYSAFTIN